MVDPGSGKRRHLLQQIGRRGGGGEESKVRQCDEHKIQTMGERRQKLMTCNSGIEAQRE